MTTSIAFALTGTLILGATAAPAQAQHMNADDAPCQDAGSNVDTSKCFYDALQRNDRRLNDIYRQVMNALEPESKTALRAAQRAWITYRDSACAAEAESYRGGTAMGMVRTACLEALTRERIRSLERGFAS